MRMAEHKKWAASLIMFVGMLLTVSYATAKSPASQYAAEIKQAEKLGKIIYDKDTAAWVGTDKMLAELGNDVSGLPLRGWVTDKEGSRYRVNFIGETDGEFKVYYQAWTKGKKVKKTKTHMDGIALTEAQMTMWAARQKILKQDYKKCAEKYNTIVVPYESGGVEKLYVYLFAATTDLDKVVLGGHHRYTLSGGGTKIEEHIEFTKSCITLDKQTVPDGTSLAAMMVSHLKTDYPQEHHVFAALSHGLSLYVMATNSSSVYEVRKGKIRVVDTKK